MSTQEKHLYYLSELKGYKVDHHDHDIRGWLVKDVDNRIVGKVDNLLVNKEIGKVVYVDVEVDSSIIDANHDPYAAQGETEIHEFINKEGENHIIIPIGLIDLNAKDKYVYTESINYETFAETKRYKAGTFISRDYERHVLGSYNRNRRLDDDLSENEIHRTRTAYTHDEPVTELRDSEARNQERLEEERLREERRIAQAKNNEIHRDSTDDLEDKIRREKENLRYKSERNKSVNDDYTNRRKTDFVDDSYHPEPTIDEKTDWERENKLPLEEDPYKNRRRTRRESEESFYDRREFRDRDYRE